MAMSMRERLAAAIREYSFVFEDNETIEAMVDAVLSELEKPTAGMVEAMGMEEIDTGWEADYGKGKLEAVTCPIAIALMDARCREVDRTLSNAFTAAIHAAKEGK